MGNRDTFDRASRRIRGLSGPGLVEAIGRGLFAAGSAIQVDAQVSITNGKVSGRGHIPSRPGEPPNQDTGLLASSIETVLVEPLKVEVSANAPYSIPLEFGTSKMAARPYMAPAAAKNRDKASATVAAAVSAFIKSKS